MALRRKYGCARGNSSWMLYSTVLNLIFIPALCVILKTWLVKLSARRLQEVEPASEDVAA